MFRGLPSRRLRSRKSVGMRSAVDSNELKAVVDAANLRPFTWETADELNVSHATVAWHLKRTGKVEGLDEWMPSWPIISNPAFSKCVRLVLVLFWSTCDVWNGKMESLRQTTTLSGQWLDPGEAPKHFTEPTVHQRNVDYLVISSRLILHSFLPLEAITAEMYCGKLGKMHGNCIEFTRHWSTEKMWSPPWERPSAGFI